MFQNASYDTDTQKQGLDLILHRFFPISYPEPITEDAWSCWQDDDHRTNEERRIFQRIFACIPVRCSIIHIVVPNPEKFALAVPSTIEMFGKDERGRIRFHQGNATQYLYSNYYESVHFCCLPLS